MLALVLFLESIAEGPRYPSRLEKMELNISTCLSGPLMVEGVAVTWNGLGCFGSIWAFSWAGSPHPVLEMVLAG